MTNVNSINEQLKIVMQSDESLKSFYRFIILNPDIDLHDSCQIVVAQPTAGRCFTYSEWNAMGRRINYGKHGIRYVDRNRHTHLVFDENDTNGKEINLEEAKFSAARFYAVLNNSSNEEYWKDHKTNFDIFKSDIRNYLEINGYLSEDEQRNAHLIEGVSFMLYTQTDEPITNYDDIQLSGLDYELRESADVVKNIYRITADVKSEVEQKYIELQSVSNTKDIADVDTLEVGDCFIRMSVTGDEMSMITSLDGGIYADDVVVTTNKGDYSVTNNIDKYKLVNDYEYIGNYNKDKDTVNERWNKFREAHKPTKKTETVVNEDKYSKGLEFKLSEDRTFYYVRKGTCTDTDIVIPEKYNNILVRVIAPNAFKEDKELKSIVVPDRVTTIGNNAFEGCSALTNITMGESVANIENHAFEDCLSLKNITLSKNLVRIGVGAFSNCYALESIIIPDEVKQIGFAAFSGCSNLQEINVPNADLLKESKLPANCIIVDRSAEKVEEEVEDKKFYDSTMSDIVPDKTEEIKNTYSEGLKYQISEFEDSYSVIGIGDCTDTDIRIPLERNGKPVTRIGSAAFYDTNIESVTVPDSVTEMGTGAFMGCIKLKSVKLSNNLTAIGNAAFLGDEALEEIALPDSITAINDAAFQGCKALKKLYIPDSVTYIGEQAVLNCDSLKEISVAKEDVLKASYYKNLGLPAEEVRIPDGCKVIDRNKQDSLSEERKTAFIDKFLIYGNGGDVNRLNIAKHYAENGADILVDDIKNIYYATRWAGENTDVMDYVEFLRLDNDGMTMLYFQNPDDDKNSRVEVSWTELANRLQTLLDNGEYLNEEETKQFEAFLAPKSHEQELLDKYGERMSPAYNKYLTNAVNYPEAVVIQRLGDFYEVMGEKAKTVTEELNLTLTSRDVGLAERVPMCGFPYHIADKYIDKIIENHSVLVVEDGEEPKYILSHAEVKAETEPEANKKPQSLTKKYPQLIEIDEPSPFDVIAAVSFSKEESEAQLGFIETEDEPDEYEEYSDDDAITETPEEEVKEQKPKVPRTREAKKGQISLFDIAEEAKEPTAKEKLIEWGLKRGSGVEYGKYRIYDKYATNPTTAEFAKFLKSEYGFSGGSRTDGYCYDTLHGKYQLEYRDREHPENNIKVELTWTEVANGIANLIDENNYFTEEEKDEYAKIIGRHNERINAITDDEKIKVIVKQFVDIATERTPDGTYILQPNQFDEAHAFVYDHIKEIEVVLSEAEQVKSIIPWKHGYFSNLGEIKVELYPQYCKRLKDQETSKAEAQEDSVKPEEGTNTDLNAILDQSQLGGAKTRYRNNVEAIRLVNKLYQDAREATIEEKAVLAKYVGWGGLPQAFDKDNEQWGKEYVELKDLLSPTDYEMARSSTLNAHFTAKEVISAMYNALSKFGVKGYNRILEPAMGTGNFFGFMPEEIADEAKLYGVELDNVTGRIATKLYPEANIQIKGFEETTFPDNFFDLTVTNVPFGNYSVSDGAYNRYKFLIHDYFIAKSVDKVKDGGIVAVVTSKGTMDKLNPSVRKYIAERADLIGAIRLPNNAFKQTAGTEVVADILFLQKHEGKSDITSDNTEWLNVGKTQEGYEINNYFIKHPEMVLGNLVKERGLYGAEDVTVKPDGRTLEEALSDAVEQLPSGIYENRTEPYANDNIDEAIIYSARQLEYVVVDNAIYQRVGEQLEEVTLPKVPKDAFERIKGMIGIRKSLREVLNMQTRGCTDEELQIAQWQLNSKYDLFVEKYGNLNTATNAKLFREDADSALLLGSELVSETNGEKTYTKNDIYSKRTIRAEVEITHTDDCREALNICRNLYGNVDIAKIEELTGKGYDEVLNELGSTVYRNPEKVIPYDKYSGFETSAEYLSGNVVEKLKLVQALTEASKDIQGKFEYGAYHFKKYHDAETVKANNEYDSIYIGEKLNKEDETDFDFEMFNAKANSDGIAIYRCVEDNNLYIATPEGLMEWKGEDENASKGLKIEEVVKSEKYDYVTGKYVPTEMEYAVTGIGDCADSDIVIPKYHNGNLITKIDDSAFRNNKDITSVIIPDSITKIDGYSFYYCKNLQRVDIKGNDNIKNGENYSASIGYCAFYGCENLKGVHIPDRITSISSSAFKQTAIKAVTICEDTKFNYDYDETIAFDKSTEVTKYSVGKRLRDKQLDKVRFSPYDTIDGYTDWTKNLTALEKVQPERISASDISVRIGATWVDKQYYKEFICDLLNISYWNRDNGVEVFYNEHDSSWNVSVQSNARRSAGYNANQKYGTSRVNAFKLFECLLNQREITVRDAVDDGDKKKYVINQEETLAAREKKQQIENAFKEWIFNDAHRREKLENTYNELFNSERLEVYDGSYLKFPSMNPAIELNPHQRNAVERMMTGNNTLLHHVVGAGKTYTTIAAIMKLRQNGMIKKAMVVVPNHLVEQWNGQWHNLYPNAKILVATKEDLEKQNRKRFISRAAMGDWDGIIIAQSSFSKIPVSKERQIKKIETEIDNIDKTIEFCKKNGTAGRSSNVKNLELIKKRRAETLKKLLAEDKKDELLKFEELGVDYLVVDEAQYYKNRFIFTKMNNVAGISTAASQRSADLEMKIDYINEQHGGEKGVVFATGTPISNSMTEMFTMQSYLQKDTMNNLGMSFFDGWAANFGETVVSLELAPSGQGYRAKTRFSKFTNLPELMNLYRMFTDIQTADMVKLNVPEAEHITITLKPSERQMELADEIVDRSEKISMGGVDPRVDNMLKITSDGKKLALDVRLMDSKAEDEPDSKINTAAQNIYDVWNQTTDIKGTQLVFCDMSTPKKAFKDYEYGKDFDAYNELKYKLVKEGIPEEEIAIIHDYNSDKQKQALFDDVNAGRIRVLIGSTEKCGAGTNVQQRMVALHHLDTPYRPSDMEQREGRIIRQGNTNKNVKIYTYVTERTFDSYSYQILENKQRFISQINSGNVAMRVAEDIDEQTLSYAEIKAITAANPQIKHKLEVDTEISKLRLLENAYKKNKYELEYKVNKELPEAIERQTYYLNHIKADKKSIEENWNANYTEDTFKISVRGKIYTDLKEGRVALTEAFAHSIAGVTIAEYGGFKIALNPIVIGEERRTITLKCNGSYELQIGESAQGNLERIDNFLKSFERKESTAESTLEELKRNLEIAKEEVVKPFMQKERLEELLAESVKLNAELDLNRKNEIIIEDENEEGAMQMAIPENNNSGKTTTKYELSTAVVTTADGKNAEEALNEQGNAETIFVYDSYEEAKEAYDTIDTYAEFKEQDGNSYYEHYCKFIEQNMYDENENVVQYGDRIDSDFPDYAVDYKSEVIESVQEEYAAWQHKLEQIPQTERYYKDFEEKNKLGLYNVLTEGRLEEEVYKTLANDKGKIINNLYDYFVYETEEATVADYDSARQFVSDYVNHQKEQLVENAEENTKAVETGIIYEIKTFTVKTDDGRFVTVTDNFANEKDTTMPKVVDMFEDLESAQKAFDGVETYVDRVVNGDGSVTYEHFCKILAESEYELNEDDELDDLVSSSEVASDFPVYVEKQEDNADNKVFNAENSFGKQVDDVLNGADTISTHLMVCTTPYLLREVGLPDLPILMTAKHLKSITQESGKDNMNYHNLDIEVVKKLPELISDPVMIMDSLTREDSIVVVTSSTDSKGSPVIGAIMFDGRGNYNDVEIEANILTSVYGKDNFNSFLKRNINENNILYCNKRKSQELLETPGIQFPNNFQSLSFNTIIRKSKAFVNSFDENNSEKVTDEPDKMLSGPFYINPLAEQALKNGKLGVTENGYSFVTEKEFPHIDHSKGTAQVYLEKHPDGWYIETNYSDDSDFLEAVKTAIANYDDRRIYSSSLSEQFGELPSSGKPLSEMETDDMTDYIMDIPDNIAVAEEKMPQNMNTGAIDYKAEVIKSVEQEFNDFKERVMRRSPEEIFNSNYEIGVKTELKEFLINNDDDLEPQFYKALYQEKGRILYSLYDDFRKNDEASVDSFEDTQDFIKDYCKYHYSDIVNEEEDYNEAETDLQTEEKTTYEVRHIITKTSSGKAPYTAWLNSYDPAGSNFTWLETNSELMRSFDDLEDAQNYFKQHKDEVVSVEKNESNGVYTHNGMILIEVRDDDYGNYIVHYVSIPEYNDKNLNSTMPDVVEENKMENKTYTPIYYKSAQEAYSGGSESDEAKAYRDSHQATNALLVDFRKSINEHTTVPNNGLGTYVDKDIVAKEMIEKYGIERVKYMCATIILNQDWDERYSRQNKEWAKTIQVSESEDVRKNIYTSVHPTVVDSFTDTVKQLEKEILNNSEENKMADEQQNKYLTETARGDKVVDITKDKYGRDIAVIQREKDFVVGIGYNTADGTWAQGKDNLESYEEADNFRKGIRTIALPESAKVCELSKVTLFRMPNEGTYGGYTYAVFNDRIKTEETEQGNIVKFDVNVDDTILLQKRSNGELGDERELSDEDLATLLSDTKEADYLSKYVSTYVPEDSIIKEYDKSSLVAMPKDSPYSGYSYFAFTEDGKKAGTVRVTFTRDYDYKLTARGKKDITLKGGELAKMVEKYTVMTEEKAEPEMTDEAKSETKWTTVVVPEKARIAKYDNDKKKYSIFKMPQGCGEEYEGCVYIVRNAMVKEQDDGNLRLVLPDNFSINLAEHSRDFKASLQPEEFAKIINGKGEADYPEYIKPEKKVNKVFEEAEAKLRVNVPEEMKNRPNWVAVRTYEKDNGKLGKWLLNVKTGKHAESDNPETWTDFETACAWARDNGCVTLAYAIDGKDGIACIDIDHCIGEDGKLTETAAKIMDMTKGTYSEKSVSGNGLHVWGKTKGSDLRSFSKDNEVEYYQKTHFITMTGNEATTSELKSFDSPEISEYLSKKFDKRPEYKPASGGAGIEGLTTMGDREVVETGCKKDKQGTFERLYKGEDIFNDHSRSDMSLFNKLAYFCNGNRDQMIRVFQTSGLFRPEKSPEYYEYTATKAVREITSRYDPHKYSKAKAPKSNSSDKNGK